MIQIQSKKDAELAIEAICQWIKTQLKNPSDEYDDIQDIRTWAWELLEAANADGRYGCRLCQVRARSQAVLLQLPLVVRSDEAS